MPEDLPYEPQVGNFGKETEGIFGNGTVGSFGIGGNLGSDGIGIFGMESFGSVGIGKVGSFGIENMDDLSEGSMGLW